MLGVFNRRLVFLGLLLPWRRSSSPAGGGHRDRRVWRDAGSGARSHRHSCRHCRSRPTAAAVPATEATPTATPVSTSAPTQTVMSGPSGSLNVGMAEVAPVSHVLHLQTYSSFKYDALMTHETMFRRDKDANLHPMLVKDWDVDPAGLVWTFRFEEGVPWHTTFGEWGEFSADDFIFSLENVITEGSRHSTLAG